MSSTAGTDTPEIQWGHSVEVDCGVIMIAHPLPELIMAVNELSEVTGRVSIVTSFLSCGSSA
ncbi:hypothetical protein TBK1r_41530 [Stieleria magnilauensis]|uniref:Uncharacterized protein n=1 Tax=Stieleria magnilauensis TaxID=2527963 RepID=A0ABX5XT64_9BACT|nr:hypothetical protein TBK1r_41530 [Planctomycetes bacterium TBK1r]